jgi:hypothetical protein
MAGAARRREGPVRSPERERLAQAWSAEQQRTDRLQVLRQAREREQGNRTGLTMAIDQDEAVLAAAQKELPARVTAEAMGEEFAGGPTIEEATGVLDAAREARRKSDAVIAGLDKAIVEG